MSRLLRVVLVLGQCLILLGFPAAPVYAADLNAEAIATGLRDFGLRLNDIGSFGALSEALPLTNLSPSADEVLRLHRLFGDTLTAGLAPSYTSLAALASAIDGLDGIYGGVAVAFDSVTVAVNGTNSDLIDVGFSVTATRAVTLPISFSDSAVSLNGGGIPLNLQLNTSLNFQLDKTKVVSEPALAFYLVGEPTISLSAQAGGPVGTFDSRLGFAEIHVTGSAALSAVLNIVFVDPSGNGKITIDEWTNAALADLVNIGFADAPGNDVDASLSFEALAPLDIPGSPDASISLVDANLADGFGPTVTHSFGALDNFTHMDPAQMLRGIGQLASGLLAAQGAGDLRLPFLQQSLGDAVAFARPLLDFLHRQGDAVIVCGTTDTDLPTGDVQNVTAGTTVYCQAIALQNPTAVTWSITDGTAGANAASLDTVGSNPTLNAAFTLTAAGRPKVQVQFTDPAGESHTVTPIFRSAQELLANLLELADLDSANLNYDQATASLTYHLLKTSDPDPIEGRLNFGDQLRSDSNLVGLSPDSSASASIDPSNIGLDATFGVILVSDAASITPGDDATYPTGVEDRFFIKVRSGPGEYEFQADATVNASVSLTGHIGFLDVSVAGDATKNTANPGTAFEVARADSTKPMLGVDISAPGIPVGSGPSAFTIPDAIRIRELLGTLGTNIHPTCNVKVTAGLRATASTGNPPTPLASGGIAVSWPDVFGGDCLPDTAGLSVTPDGQFNTDLKVFDIDPSNPVALLSVILDNLDQLASLADSLTGSSVGAALDTKLPLINLSPQDLITQFRAIHNAVNEIRTGVPDAMIRCGTVDASPPTGDLSGAEVGARIYCQAATARDATEVAWTINGGTLFANGAATATVGTSPTQNVAFDITTPGGLGSFTIGLVFKDSAGRHMGELPTVTPPRSLQKLEEVLESKLGIPSSALELDLVDLPSPGSTTPDGVKDLVIRLGAGICTDGNANIPDCAESDRTVDKLSVPLKLDLAALPGLVGLNTSASFQVEYSAHAQLDLGVPLADSFDPTDIVVVDTSGVTLQAAVSAENVSLNANVGPLTLAVGSGIQITDGTHDGSADASTLADSTADFVSAKVPVGATLRNTTDGSSCVVSSVTATTLECTLAGGSENDWDTGDAYQVFGIGVARLGARFTLAKSGIDGIDNNETFGIGSFVTGLGADLDGPATPYNCGDANGETMGGDACANVSLALVIGSSTTYLGNLGFRAADITDPDDLSTPEKWYVTAPPDLGDQIANAVMDWGLLLHGLDALLDNVEQMLNGAASGIHVPLIGDALDAGADIVGTINRELISPLADLADALRSKATAGNIRAEIQDQIFNAIGPASATHLLLDANGDSSVTKADIAVTLKCGSADCADSDSVLNIDDLRLTFSIGQGLGASGAPAKGCSGGDCVNGLSVPFDIGLPGLPLRSAGTLEAQAGWRLLVDFGLSRSDGPYLVTSGAGHGTEPELGVGAAVGIGDAASDVQTECNANDPQLGGDPAGLQGFSPTRCLIGTVGFLQVTLRDGADGDATPNTDDDPSRLALLASLNLTSSAGDRLNFAQLTSGEAGLQLAVDATANVDLRIRTGLREGENYGLPSVLGTFHFSWGFAWDSTSGTGPDQPTQIKFNNLYLDAGAFVSRFLGPIVNEIKNVTSPLQPVIDTVRAPLPVLSDLSRMLGGGPISLLSLLEAATGSDLTMLENLMAFIDFVNNLPSETTLLIPLGNSPGSFDVNAAQAMAGPLTPDQADALVTNADSRSGLLSDIGGGSNTDSAFGVTGLSFPFLNNSSQLFGLLMGKDVTLIRWDAGTMRASAGVSYTFGPIFIGPIPISVTIAGSATIQGRFAIGYDTSGLRQLLSGATGEHLFDGIFIDDLDSSGADVPEISLIGTISAAAGIDIFIASAGVEGGISLTIDMNLNDSPDHDGKLRINEIFDKLANPVCLFDISGKLTAFLNAYVRIGFSFFSKTWRFRLASVTLIDFSLNLCHPPDPVLASVSGGVLRLNVGPSAGARGIAVQQKDEKVIVRQLTAALPGLFSVSSFGVYQEYGGVSSIWADFGDGNDVLSLEPGADSAGDAIFFTASATILGGTGNDQIKSGDGSDNLSGGAGDDHINGGGGGDAINGGGDDDVLAGELGVDTVHGDGGNDVITGGPGGDMLNGDDGDDDLHGGPGTTAFPDGADVITGGPGNDSIEGDEAGDQLYGDEVLACGDAGAVSGGNDQLVGGPGDDQAWGGYGLDALSGEDGSDTLCGNAGNDLLEGDDDNLSTPDGDDHLFGGLDDDTLYGRGGHDELFGDNPAGGSGNDLLFGGSGPDDLYGGDGRDILQGETGSDILLGDAGSVAGHSAGAHDGSTASVLALVTPTNAAAVGAIDCSAVGSGGGNADCLYGGDGNDFLFGEGGHDRLFGDAGQDYEQGNAGDDMLRGGQQADEMYGNAGADEMYGDSGTDRMFGGTENDTMRGGADDDYMEGNQHSDTMLGDGGDDDMIGGSSTAGSADGGETLMSGGEGSDLMAGDNATITRNSPRQIVLLDVPFVGTSEPSGASGNDVMHGDEGQDVMYGQSGDDAMSGGEADDYLEGNAGADTLSGDLGDDDLIGGSGHDNGNGGLRLLDNVVDENVGGFGDMLHGGDGLDLMAGDNANITRGGGRQIVLYNVDFAGDGVTVAAALSGDDTLTGDLGSDVMYGQGGMDNLSGGEADDYLEGNSGADTLAGDLGDDDLIGGSGHDNGNGGFRELRNVLDQADTLQGGEQADYLLGDNGSLTRPGGSNAFNGSARRNVTLYDVQIVGGPAVSASVSGADTLSGGPEDDVMFGQGQDDTLHGGDGADYLEGNHDSDLMYGDAGEDDLTGGGSANDGVIDADRLGHGLLDTGDRMYGDDGDPATPDDGDVMAGDNARITRPVDGGGQWMTDPNTGDVIRQVTLFDVQTTGGPAVDPATSGLDLMFGEGGRDFLFGQGNGAAGDSAGSDPPDGVDNDRNGREAGGSAGVFDCLDGRDNDGDGLMDGADPQCAAAIDNSPGGDELHGGPDDDYLEGNAGSDWMFGDDGEDDLIGGSAAGNGVVGGGAAPTNLRDGHDVMSGGGDDDVLLGDNAQVTRPTDSGGLWRRLVGGAFDLVMRDTAMAQTPEAAGAYGNDWMSGGDGVDDLYGQLGNDYLEGNDGEDAMLGDLGKITNNLLGVSDGVPDPGSEQSIAPSAPFFDPGEVIFRTGSLYRQVVLYSFVTGSGGGGNDTLYGGPGDDSLHGGPGDDIVNGNAGDDHLFGGDDSDAMWGGPGHDDLFGGYGIDYLDVLPRPARADRKDSFPADPPTWFEAARFDNFTGLDIMYGGWDRDWMQADVSAPGPPPGDRMVDSVGAFNAYYRCDAAYGDWGITRQLSPSLIDFLQRLAQGRGATDTASTGTSGFRETAIVFPQDAKANSNAPNADNPAHFVCSVAGAALTTTASTSTPMPTATATSTSTSTATATATPVPTDTPTPTATETATATPLPTDTPAPTATETATDTATPEPTATETPTETAPPPPSDTPPGP